MNSKTANRTEQGPHRKPSSASSTPVPTGGAPVAVTLMGRPRLAHTLGSHDDAMQMLSLLVLAWHFLPPEQTAAGLSRDWVAATLSPALFQADPQAARDKARYLVNLLDDGLGIRDPESRQEGRRERGVYRLTLDRLTVDILDIRRAARDGRGDAPLKDAPLKADGPLLAGLPYPWLDDPFFERIGATLDIWCLHALLSAVEALLAEAGAAEARGGSRARTSRAEACTLMDKAALWLTERRSLLRRKEPALLMEIARRLTECRVRAVHPLPSLETGDRHLPDPATNLIGRNHEIEAILSLMRTERLVTLTGIGGAGKTRLALAAAEGSRSGFAEDAVFADFSAVAETEPLARTLALTLGLAGDARQDWPALLPQFFGDRSLLLVWDNCEQIAPACRALAETLLAACPRLHLLVTSREPLTVNSSRASTREALYPVPALSLPEDAAQIAGSPDDLREYDSLRLLEARVQALRPQFSLTAENGPAALQICRDMDGLPLAIELAAALAADLTLPQIALTLRERRALLSGGARIGTLRHASLDAAFALSYDRLSPPEQRAFRFLGVFRGGATAAAAEHVLPERRRAVVRETLAQLARKSLIVLDERGGEPRFRLLETVRRYAEERLAECSEREEAGQRHCAFYLGLMEEAEAHLQGPEPQPWMDRLDVELPNLRAALDLRQDGASLRAACAVLRFWRGRGLAAEGRRRLEVGAGGAAGVPDALRIQALNGAGSLAFALGDFAEARRLHQESLARARRGGNAAGEAAALNGLGGAEAHLGDYGKAKEQIEESLRIRRGLGDHAGIAGCLSSAGMIANYRCDYAGARAQIQEALEITQRLGDVHSAANCLYNIGIITHYQQDYGAAQACFTESLALWRRMKDRYSIAKALSGLGEVALHRDDCDAAQDFYEESLALRKQVGDKYGEANSLNGLGEAACGRGDHSAAQALLGEALALRHQIGDTQSIPHSLFNLGVAAARRGDRAAARGLFQDSLRLMRESGDGYAAAYALESLALTADMPEEAPAAARMLGAADALRLALSNPRVPPMQDSYRRGVEAVRGLTDRTMFDDAWREGRNMAWQDAAAFAGAHFPKA